MSYWCDARGCRRRGPYRTGGGLKNHQNACKPFLEERDRIEREIRERVIAKRRRLEEETAEQERAALAEAESLDLDGLPVEEFIPIVSRLTLSTHQSAAILNTHI